MKKRSLFAAVAMLIVSAIVLTSATYAWFVAGQDSVAVTGINATITNNDGSLALRAKVNNSSTTYVLNANTQQPELAGTAKTYGNWQPSLSADDFSVKTSTSDNTHVIPTVLKPVDMYLNAGTVVMKGLTYNGSDFQDFVNVSDTDGYYQHYSFEVQLTTNDETTGKDVYMKPTFARGENFVYALVKVGNDYYLYAETTDNSYDTYEPIKKFELDQGGTGTVKVLDTATPKAILNTGAAAADQDTATGDTVYELAAAQTSQNQNAIQLWDGQKANIPEGESVLKTEFVKEVEIWVFAEGQDTGCIPRAINASNINIGFKFQSVPDGTAPGAWT